ncbi:hypothetical protein ISR92_01090 [Patescibacteria group bacterium]|nr:hypothetical protein [Patescibacteria group bacterium]
MKAWCLITYRASFPNGYVNKTQSTSVAFLDTGDDVLVTGVVEHLLVVETVKSIHVENVQSLNQDGTTDELLRGYVGSDISKACTKANRDRQGGK